PGAKFSNPEVMLGMVPGWMGIERVLNQVGPVVGRQMLMLGKRLTAQEAQAANLIDEVVEKEQVESWMANQLAQLEKCGPVALAHIKQLILALENKHADYPHQLLAGLMSATQDCQQATRAFAEKSSVRFHNQ
ncbi:enoyl-CoA hydratase/isomerase family protein, partial [Escherichia coli]|nr:enoyl-CoA hydratase/isomerase family protein [Escherichia coli]